MSGRTGLVTGGVVLAGACLAQLVTPPPVSDLLFGVTAALGVLGMIFGPLLDRSPELRAFRLITLGGLWCLGSSLLRMRYPSGGPWWGTADAWALIGYLHLALFLVVLRRTASGRIDRLALSDSMIIATGAALAQWSVDIAPGVLGGRLEHQEHLLMAGFPVLDVLILSLTFHLALRVSRRGVALWSFLIGISALLLGDAFYGLLDMTDASPGYPAVRALYMVAYVLAGLTAAHPSKRLMLEPGQTEGTRISWMRRAFVVLAMTTPSVAALLAPAYGAADRAVRAGMLAVLLTAVQRRLNGTIDALGEAEERSRRQATHDSLTDLPNRTALLRDAEAVLAGGPGGPPDVALLLLTVEQVHQVVSTWGPEAGDGLITVIAGRLRDQAGEPGHATVYRIGGDEFAVLVLAAPEAALALAHRIGTACLDRLPLTLGPSITVYPAVGVATAAVGSVSVIELVRDAETALSQARRNGPASVVLFDESLRTSQGDRILLAEDLRNAVTAGQIEPFYQPIRGGHGYAELAGFEALARWHHPERGMISPGLFIPIAEATGSILDIGEFILVRACHQLVQWRTATGLDLHVSVNVSQVQIARTDVPALVERVLQETRLPAHALWIEITESLVAESLDLAMAALTRLKALGVTLALDDFGTGYSSLSYLKDFPIDVIKIDRSFVSCLGSDERVEQLTKVIVEIARTLRLTGVVAEGVETGDQAARLAALDCAWGQGWLFGKPLPAGETVLPTLPTLPTLPAAQGDPTPV